MHPKYRVTEWTLFWTNPSTPEASCWHKLYLVMIDCKEPMSTSVCFVSPSADGSAIGRKRKPRSCPSLHLSCIGIMMKTVSHGNGVPAPSRENVTVRQRKKTTREHFSWRSRNKKHSCSHHSNWWQPLCFGLKLHLDLWGQASTRRCQASLWGKRRKSGEWTIVRVRRCMQPRVHATIRSRPF